MSVKHHRGVNDRRTRSRSSPPSRIARALPAIVGAALVAVAPRPAAAGPLDAEITSRTTTASDIDKVVPSVSADGKFFVVPVPIVDPTVGYGVAPTALYTFSADPANPGTPRSTIAAVAGYTSTQSWFGGGGAKLYLDDDRWRVGAKAGYGELNVQFYGFGGNDFLRTNPIGLNLRGPVAELNGQGRLFEGFYLGLKLRWLDPGVTLDSPVSFLPSLTLEQRLIGLGPTIEYDTRNSTWYPTDGTYGTLDLLRYDKAGIADARFWLGDAAIARYGTIADGLVLAGQLRAAHAGDGAPFFMLPFINLRGLPAGLFLDVDVAQAQAELRWEVGWGVGLVAFGGGGGAFGSYQGSSGAAAYALAGGAGVRYRISEVDHMNIGIDVAVGIDAGTSVYFRIGEAF